MGDVGGGRNFDHPFDKAHLFTATGCYRTSRDQLVVVVKVGACVMRCNVLVIRRHHRRQQQRPARTRSPETQTHPGRGHGISRLAHSPMGRRRLRVDQRQAVGSLFTSCRQQPATLQQRRRAATDNRRATTAWTRLASSYSRTRRQCLTQPSPRAPGRRPPRPPRCVRVS